MSNVTNEALLELAERCDGIAKTAREALSRHKAPLFVAGDDVEQVIEILWSMADTDGSPGDMRRCAERIVAALLVSDRSGVGTCQKCAAREEAGRRALEHYYETMCPCDAAERYVPTCSKHGARTVLDTPTSDKGEG